MNASDRAYAIQARAGELARDKAQLKAEIHGGSAMTPKESDVVIAEKVMGWCIEYRPTGAAHDTMEGCYYDLEPWWREKGVGGKIIIRVRDFHPSRDYNRLHEAEMRLTTDQMTEHVLRLQEENPVFDEIMSRYLMDSGSPGNIALANDCAMRLLPAATCAVCMAEVVLGEKS